MSLSHHLYHSPVHWLSSGLLIGQLTHHYHYITGLYNHGQLSTIHAPLPHQPHQSITPASPPIPPASRIFVCKLPAATSSALFPGPGVGNWPLRHAPFAASGPGQRLASVALQEHLIRTVSPPASFRSSMILWEHLILAVSQGTSGPNCLSCNMLLSLSLKNWSSLRWTSGPHYLS